MWIFAGSLAFFSEIDLFRGATSAKMISRDLRPPSVHRHVFERLAVSVEDDVDSLSYTAIFQVPPASPRPP